MVSPLMLSSIIPSSSLTNEKFLAKRLIFHSFIFDSVAFNTTIEDCDCSLTIDIIQTRIDNLNIYESTILMIGVRTRTPDPVTTNSGGDM